MKAIALFLILAFSSVMLSGQSYAWAMDSLTKRYLAKLPVSKQIQFDSILSQRLAIDLSTRIDTLDFDYAFIEENFCFADSIGAVEERYFRSLDSIPTYVFFDGLFYDPKKVYNGHFIWYSKNVTHLNTFRPLFKKYTGLKSIQELPYARRQIWEHGCVVIENGELDFKQERSEQLKSTFQIQTMIDKQKQKVIVSIQLAPKKPRFKTISYNAVWDW